MARYYRHSERRIPHGIEIEKDKVEGG